MQNLRALSISYAFVVNYIQWPLLLHLLSKVEAERTTSMEQKIILNLNNVSKNNNNSNKGGQVFLERTLLHNVNLDIREGEFITSEYEITSAVLSS
jgi:hypothetical protein